MRLKKIKQLKSEEKALKEAKLDLQKQINAARRKIYAKHNNLLKRINSRLFSIEDEILDLCDLIK